MVDNTFHSYAHSRAAIKSLLAAVDGVGIDPT
jgi:hypothetical protein